MARYYHHHRREANSLFSDRRSIEDLVIVYSRQSVACNIDRYRPKKREREREKDDGWFGSKVFGVCQRSRIVAH